jgi:hypothetical protein
MIQSVGHHTVEKTGESIADRINLGPVKSIVLDENGKPKEKPPFAGDGYYFWEDNIDAANWWGERHYSTYGKPFRIFRIDLILRYNDSSFFDLVGSRQHLRLLGSLINKTKKSIDCEGWKLHNFIAYFRLLNTRNKGMFPFKMVRFNDFSLNPKFQSPIYLRGLQHMTLMNPFYIVCVFEREDLDLKSFIFIK